MILHVDGNSFYCSCERLFRPDLRDKPVVVLSNNDGIIVALTAEAKALGLRRGDAFFKKKSFCESNGVAVFSSNYTLYADISSRLNAIYSLFAEKTEIYSIDESFMFVPDLNGMDYTEFGRFLRDLIKQQVGIPISVGIAPTKTLAKLCNKLAKKHGGVFNWMECNHEEALRGYAVEDVWNVGRSKAEWLRSHGINNALALSCMPLDKAKKALSITGMNTVMELCGKQTIEYVSRPLSQNICSSRSFKTCVYELDELIEALTYFCTTAVRKMRAEKQCCRSIYVMLATAFPFETEFDPLKHYYNGVGKKLPGPTSFLPEILENAVELLKSLFRGGFGYRKAVVNLLDLVPEDNSPQLFETEYDRKKEAYGKVMDAFDEVNARFGKETVFMGSGTRVKPAAEENWELRRDYKSPDYTTDRLGFPEAT